MNLRDKLRAVGGGQRPAAPQKPVNGDCLHCFETRDAVEFPGAMAVRRETVTLMQGEELPASFDPRRILYLDTETTGFAGAGTVAFLVGLGWWGEDGFEVHQYLMRDYPEERYVLEKTAEACERFDVLCTFNGRSFDVPLLRDRFLLNRIPAACLDKPHIDLLHIARRIWRLRLKRCSPAWRRCTSARRTLSSARTCTQWAWRWSGFIIRRRRAGATHWPRRAVCARRAGCGWLSAAAGPESGTRPSPSGRA